MSTKKYRISLSADLESDDYDNERMDVNVTFIAHNTLDIYFEQIYMYSQNLFFFQDPE